MKRRKRYDWLNWQIQRLGYRVGAEVGCAEGNTTMRLLKHNPKLRLYAVDMWGDRFSQYSDYSKEIYKDWDFNKIWRTFLTQTRPYQDRLIILRGCSWQVVKDVKEKLDFVFIDADHTYDMVIQDIVMWGEILKEGGMVCGHDCNLPEVRRALNMILPGWKETGIDNVWYGYKYQIR